MNIYAYEFGFPWNFHEQKTKLHEYAMNEAKWCELYDYEYRQKLCIVIKLIWTVWIDFLNLALK